MPNPLPVQYPDGTVFFLDPLPRARLKNLETLLSELQTQWQENFSRQLLPFLEDPAIQDLMQRIINLFPRHDIPGGFGIDLKPILQVAIATDDPHQLKHVVQLQELFLVQLVSRKANHCKLISFHQYEPLPAPAWQEKDPDTAVPSSGNPDMDMLANLTLGMEGRFEAAWLAFNTLNSYQLDCFLFSLNEMRRDPEERRAQRIGEDYAAYKQENQEEWRKGMGIEVAKPADAAPEEATFIYTLLQMGRLTLEQAAASLKSSAEEVQKGYQSWLDSSANRVGGSGGSAPLTAPEKSDSEL